MSEQVMTTDPDSNAAQGAETAQEKQERSFIRWLYWPTIGFLIAIAIFPLLFSIGISFTNYTLAIPGTKFIGFQNYVSIIASGDMVRAGWVSIRFTVFAVSIEMVLGILIALILNEKIPGTGIVRIIVILPMMLAPMVVGLFWRFLLDQTFGMVSYLLSLVGIPPVAWFVVPNNAMAAIIMVDVWQWTPFVVLLVVAALGTIPDDLKEAATLDRASLWMKFRQIYWPYLRFPVLFAFLFRLIDSLKMFDLAYTLTGGGPGDLTSPVSLLAYYYSFMYFKIGKAAAISWILVIVIVIIVNILLQVLMPS
ncbi:MAG: sugar ABC transporter permease, partial [Anaerolineales bacterium]|nr:sugar ABC transporter permease [Anaerolineales bacterium]